MWKKYEVNTISFQTFFVRAFKIVIDSWKFSMLLLYILWDDRSIFMISRSNEQLQQELEYTLLKPDCHSWWISKMQSDTLEEWYAIKLCCKLGKNATEIYGMLFDHLERIEHQFLSGIRDSRKAGSLWGMMRGVGEVRKSEHLVTDYLTKMGIKTVPHPPYSPDLTLCNFWLFPKLRGCHYETIGEMKEAVTKVIGMLTQEDFHRAFQKLLEWYNKSIAARGDYLEGD